MFYFYYHLVLPALVDYVYPVGQVLPSHLCIWKKGGLKNQTLWHVIINKAHLWFNVIKNLYAAADLSTC